MEKLSEKKYQAILQAKQIVAGLDDAGKLEWGRAVASDCKKYSDHKVFRTHEAGSFNGSTVRNHE